MAEQKPNAAVRPQQGVRQAANPSGVIHVRTSYSGQYVVIGNHLAQHHQLSLTAIGLATHIFSLPESALVDIRTLADRFPEGRERIASGLRELEETGYLKRVRERSETGRLVTRTYAHHTPERAVPYLVRGRTGAARERGPVARSTAAGTEGTSGTSQEGDQARAALLPPIRSCEPAAVDVPAGDLPGPEAVAASADSSVVPEEVAASRHAVLPQEALPSAVPEGGEPSRTHRHHDKAVALLAGLRRTDDRLTLSARDVNTLAPSVIRWFERGATADVVHRVLTFDLPVDMRRAAGVLAYRLGELLPPPLPAVTAPTPSPASVPVAGRPDPFQTCDGCERAFRASDPGRCRDCRTAAGRAGEMARAA
ncbi:helix-turn-helix domain-containing protein [Streptomyces sp. NPDC017890]|uniref:helix-turn-helix domain-containing protein n=1 Tax=Streptomyces sp. NPDC017890 TaxID=3365015 RepID=UPI0037A4CA1B